jgi:hypothetical protein
MEKNCGCADNDLKDKLGTVEGEHVNLDQSCAMNILADKVHMKQSAGGIVRAEKVKMEDSFALVVYANEIEGEAKALFSPAAALIAGGAILLALLLWRRR